MNLGKSYIGTTKQSFTGNDNKILNKQKRQKL